MIFLFWICSTVIILLCVGSTSTERQLLISELSFRFSYPNNGSISECNFNVSCNGTLALQVHSDNTTSRWVNVTTFTSRKLRQTQYVTYNNEGRNFVLGKYSKRPKFLNFSIEIGLKNSKGIRKTLLSRTIPKWTNDSLKGDSIIIEQARKFWKYNFDTTYQLKKCGGDFKCQEACVETTRYKCSIDGEKECKNPWSFPKFNCSICQSVKDKNCERKRSKCAASSYCQIPGNCVRFDSVKDHCICKDTYTGEYCMVKIKDCRPDNDTDCKNDGICIIEELFTVCKCTTGFNGRNCEYNSTFCDQNRLCKHNGTCHVFKNGYQCKCKGHWFGKDCELCKTHITENGECEEIFSNRWYWSITGLAMTFFLLGIVVSIIFIVNALSSDDHESSKKRKCP